MAAVERLLFFTTRSRLAYHFRSLSPASFQYQIVCWLLKRTVAQGGGAFKQRKRVAFSLIFFFFQKRNKTKSSILLHLLFGVGSADDSTKAKGGTP
jgi:hypothetical protein